MATHWLMPRPMTLAGFSCRSMRTVSPTDSAMASTCDGELPWQMTKKLATAPSMPRRSTTVMSCPFFSCIPFVMVLTNFSVCSIQSFK